MVSCSRIPRGTKGCCRRIAFIGAALLPFLGTFQRHALAKPDWTFVSGCPTAIDSGGGHITVQLKSNPSGYTQTVYLYCDAYNNTNDVEITGYPYETTSNPVSGPTQCVINCPGLSPTSPFNTTVWVSGSGDYFGHSCPAFSCSYQYPRCCDPCCCCCYAPAMRRFLTAAHGSSDEGDFAISNQVPRPHGGGTTDTFDIPFSIVSMARTSKFVHLFYVSFYQTTDSAGDHLQSYSGVLNADASGPAKHVKRGLRQNPGAGENKDQTVVVQGPSGSSLAHAPVLVVIFASTHDTSQTLNVWIQR